MAILLTEKRFSWSRSLGEFFEVGFSALRSTFREHVDSEAL